MPSTVISAANKEVIAAAIAALTANGSYAFPQFFVLASEYVFHLVLETTIFIFVVFLMYE